MACQHAAAPEASIYLPEPATLVRSVPMTALERLFEFRLDDGKDLGHMPGQFAEISLPGLGEAPISISSSPDLKGAFELVVRKVGRVTAVLHGLAEGDKVGVRGPFGTSFPVTGELLGKDLLFICGGIGLVPVRSAIQYVLNHRDDYGRIIILYGAKSPGELLFTEEVAAWGARDDVTLLETVDRAEAGWTKNVGVITTLIPKIQIDPAKTRVIVCGPPVMYKFVIMSLASTGLPHDQIYVSLERRMKCGVGKCGHCQINGLYTCLDGPVFTYESVKASPEAI